MSDLRPSNNEFRENPYPDDEIDLRELFMVIWSGKWVISLVTGLAAALSLLVSMSLPNIYTATTLLAPAESLGSGVSSLTRQYGGLASLAGVSLPGSKDGSRSQLGMELLKSRAFISDFVERRDILPELMAVDFWNPGTGQVVFDADIYDLASTSWVRDVEPPRAAKPSAQEAHSEFMDLLSVSENSETGYVTLSIDHHSPVIAAEWVRWLVEDVNAAVKAQDVTEAEKSIEYLKQQVANTSLADLQAMFFELIQAQTETVMLAEVRPEYVFKTIDPPVVPEEKSGPSRALICVSGMLLGAVLGVAIALIRHYAKSEQDR